MKLNFHCRMYQKMRRKILQWIWYFFYLRTWNIRGDIPKNKFPKNMRRNLVGSVRTIDVVLKLVEISHNWM